MMKRKWMWLMLLATLLVRPAEAWQSIADNKKASVAFEFDIERIKNGNLAKTFGLADNLGPMLSQMGEGSEYVMSAQKITGVVTLPEKASDFANMGDGSKALPINFHVRITFSDDTSAGKIYEDAGKTGKEVTENGRKYMTPPSTDPSNIRLSLVDKKTLEMGTVDFIGLQNVELKSSGLLKVWNSQVNSPVRIAADFSNAKNLMNEVVKTYGNDVPPQATAYFNLLEKLASLSLAIDLDGDQLIALTAGGHDASDAKDIQVAVDSLVEFGKFGFLGAGAEMKAQTPKMYAAVKKIVEGLGTQLDGSIVNMVISRPAEMDEGLAEISQMMNGGR